MRLAEQGAPTITTVLMYRSSTLLFGILEGRLIIIIRKKVVESCPIYIFYGIFCHKGQHGLHNMFYTDLRKV